jgi:hypothetical protein
MKIALHAGAHCTDEGRIGRTLLRNRDDLLPQRVSVPPLSNYTVLIREAIHALDRSAPAEDSQEVLLDTILEEDEADRLVLTNENFFGTPRMSMKSGQFYPEAEDRVGSLCQLFPDCEIELFLAIRDPGTFIPAIHAMANKVPLPSLLNDTDPGTLRWSHLITRLREAEPDVAITVWCNEDSPLVFGELIRSMAGLPENARIKGAFDLLSEIMSAEGMKRFRAYFAENPTMTEPQKRRAMTAFLKKYAIEDKVEEDLDLPPWPLEVFEYLTDAYEEDAEVIAKIPGVRMLTP